MLYTLRKLKEQGFEVELLDAGEEGNITAEQVQAAIRPDTCLVTTMFANNEIGSILPIAKIGEVCRAHGVLFHTDAVQAVGHIPVNVKKQNIDLLSLSAHKFHGPRGIGVLYARRGMELCSLMEGGGQERGKRPGTENVPAIMGMAAALKAECVLMEENARKISALREFPEKVFSFFWIVRVFVLPRALRALRGRWTRAMCCWHWEDPRKLPRDP